MADDADAEPTGVSVTFEVSVTKVGPFPAPVQPTVKLSGAFVEEEVSGPSPLPEASEGVESPGYEVLTFPSKACASNLELCDAACAGGGLKLELFDAANGDAPLLAEPLVVNLEALLQETTEVTVEAAVVTLSADVDAKWDDEEAPKTRVPTTVTLHIKTSSVLGSAADALLWNVLKVKTHLKDPPAELMKCSTPGAKDAPEIHGLFYSINILGEEVAARKSIEAFDGGPDGPTTKDWIRPVEPDFCRYRDVGFMRKLQDLLNNVGGTYVTVTVSPAVVDDPKYKPPAEVPALCDKYRFRAYLDLRPLLQRGATELEAECPLVQASGDPFTDGEGAEITPTLSLSLSLRVPILPAELPPPPEVADMLTRREVTQKLRSAEKAREEFLKAVKDSVEPASSSSSGRRPEKLVEIRIREALMKQVTEYARKSLKVDPDGTDAFVSQVFAELASQVVPDTLRGLNLTAPEPPEKAHALKEVRTQREVLVRSRRLLQEAELCGNWKTAANFWHQILAIEKTEAAGWLDYGKFLQRVGGKSEAAEFAVRKAVSLTSSASSSSSSSTGPNNEQQVTVREGKLMLVALLLDRRRFQDAEKMLVEMSEGTLFGRHHQMVNFLRGICAYLSKNDVEAGQNWFVLATKPKEWFRGLHSEEKMMEKLQLFLSAGDAMSTVTGTGTQLSSQATGIFGADSISSSSSGTKPSLEASNPLVVALEKLLDFGCARLVFTILDTAELRNVVSFGHDGLREVIEAECYMLQHDLPAAKKVLQAVTTEVVEPGVDCARCRILGEALFRLGEFEEALQFLATAIESEAFRPEVFVSVFIRLGHCYLLQGEYEHARTVFLQSVRIGATSEAWVGLAFSSYRQDQIPAAYEALREALWLDDERPDTWAFLTLVHLRLGNLLQADDCFRHTLYYTSSTMSDELLLELGVEFLKSEEHESGPYRAECAARTALAIRETGQAHEVLADSLSVQEQYEKAVLEYGIAIRLFYDQPEHRQNLVDKALHLTDEILHDAPLAESVHIAEKMAAAHAADIAKKMGGEGAGGDGAGGIAVGA
ncbi:unnamed protein product [Amoebophrya sp. A120]|nr:unnamed protein product [Amoebophrya sp. A120]|eukprot:GSA120T00018141001.1